MPEKVEITDDLFQRLQDAGEIELKSEDRHQLERGLHRYMWLKEMDQGSVNSREAERALKRVKNHVNALIKEFDIALLEGELTAEKYVLQETFFLMPERAAGRAQRQYLKQLKALQAALDKVDPATAKMSSKQGRKKSTALLSLLNVAGRIYEAAGGKATAYWSDYTGKEGSAFTDFVFELISQCPEPFRETSKEALASKIIDWRKDRSAK